MEKLDINVEGEGGGGRRYVVEREGNQWGWIKGVSGEMENVRKRVLAVFSSHCSYQSAMEGGPEEGKERGMCMHVYTCRYIYICI